MAQVLSPGEYPGQDIDAVGILRRLEQSGLIAKTATDGASESYSVTGRGTERLISDAT